MDLVQNTICGTSDTLQETCLKGRPWSRGPFEPGVVRHLITLVPHQLVGASWCVVTSVVRFFDPNRPQENQPFVL